MFPRQPAIWPAMQPLDGIPGSGHAFSPKPGIRRYSITISISTPIILKIRPSYGLWLTPRAGCGLCIYAPGWSWIHKPSESDLEISEAMATYWTNFAKYGDPNGEGVPEWPAFSDEIRKSCILDPTPHIGPVPECRVTGGT